MIDRYIYSIDDVTDTRDIPKLLANTTREQFAFGLFMNAHGSSHTYARACEVGAGYGRMTPVLFPWADKVTAFEREPHFREIGKRNWPEIEWEPSETMWTLKAHNGAFDLTLTWTFLQHVHDHHIEPVCNEIARISSNVVILCEETDHPKDGSIDTSKHICTGRMPEEYAKLLGSKFKLRGTMKRPYGGGMLMKFIRHGT